MKGSFKKCLSQETQSDGEKQSVKNEPEKVTNGSQFATNYYEFLNVDKFSLSNYFEKQEKMKLKRREFSTKMQITVKFEKQDSAIYKVKLGGFQTNVQVLYVLNQFFQLFQNTVIGKGAFGEIIEINQTQNIVIKRIQYKENQVNSIFDSLIQEYFICLIGGEIGFGPKIKKYFFYDIVVLKNSFIFCMEKCEVDFYHLKLLQNVERDLKENLKLMHSLKLCHCDIKKANIAWSMEQNKFVFLDFGLSFFINQEIGFKTLTKFVGTLNYCSEEMKKNYFSGGCDLVDLYFNDCEGVKKTCGHILLHRQYLKNMKEVVFSSKQYAKAQTEKSFEILRKYSYLRLAILNFFKNKFNALNEAKIYQLKQIIGFINKNINVMPKTLLKIYYQENLSRFLQINQQQMQLQLLKIKAYNNNSMEDTIFLKNLNGFYEGNNHVLFLPSMENLNISKYWGNKAYMVQLVKFFQKQSKKKIQEKLHNIIDNVCDHFCPEIRTKHHLFRRRFFLNKMFQYFRNQKSIQGLVFIVEQFVHISDFDSAFQTELEILRIHKRNKKYLPFFQFVMKLKIRQINQFSNSKLLFEQMWKKIDGCLDEEQQQFFKPFDEIILKCFYNNFFRHSQQQIERMNCLSEFKESFKKQIKQLMMVGFYGETSGNKQEMQNTYDNIFPQSEKMQSLSWINLQSYGKQKSQNNFDEELEYFIFCIGNKYHYHRNYYVSDFHFFLTISHKCFNNILYSFQNTQQFAYYITNLLSLTFKIYAEIKQKIKEYFSELKRQQFPQLITKYLNIFNEHISKNQIIISQNVKIEVYLLQILIQILKFSLMKPKYKQNTLKILTILSESKVKEQNIYENILFYILQPNFSYLQEFYNDEYFCRKQFQSYVEQRVQQILNQKHFFYSHHRWKETLKFQIIIYKHRKQNLKALNLIWHAAKDVYFQKKFIRCCLFQLTDQTFNNLSDQQIIQIEKTIFLKNQLQNQKIIHFDLSLNNITLQMSYFLFVIFQKCMKICCLGQKEIKKFYFYIVFSTSKFQKQNNFIRLAYQHFDKNYTQFILQSIEQYFTTFSELKSKRKSNIYYQKIFNNQKRLLRLHYRYNYLKITKKQLINKKIQILTEFESSVTNKKLIAKMMRVKIENIDNNWKMLLFKKIMWRNDKIPQKQVSEKENSTQMILKSQ